MSHEKEKFHCTALVTVLLSLCCAVRSNGASVWSGNNKNRMSSAHAPLSDLPRTSTVGQQTSVTPSSWDCECVHFNTCPNGKKAYYGKGNIRFRNVDECDEESGFTLCCSEQNTPHSTTFGTTNVASPTHEAEPHHNPAGQSAEPNLHPQEYPQGHTQGHPQGHTQGHPQEYPQGHTQGHPQGHTQGHPQGHTQGHPQGHPTESKPGACECVQFNMCLNGKKATQGAGSLQSRNEQCDEESGFTLCCPDQNSSHSTTFGTTNVVSPISELEPQHIPSEQSSESKDHRKTTKDHINSRTNATGETVSTIDYHLPAMNIKSRCGQRKYAGNFSETSGQSKFGEFPWMVAVLKVGKTNDARRFICGGTLIHKNVVLTVAHCVKSLNTSKIRVRAGDWNLDEASEEHPFQELEVSQVITHPNYMYTGSFTLEEDIALIVTKRPFEYGPNVDIVCLPKKSEIIEMKTCVAAGWGVLPGSSSSLRRTRSPSRKNRRKSYWVTSYGFQQPYDRRQSYPLYFDRLDNYDLCILANAMHHVKVASESAINIIDSVGNIAKRPSGSNQPLNNNNNYVSKGQNDIYNSVLRHNTTSIHTSAYWEQSTNIAGSAHPSLNVPSELNPQPQQVPGWYSPTTKPPTVMPSEPQEETHPPKILRKVVLPIVPNQECEERLREFPEGPGQDYMLHESLFCAGGLSGNDTCKGDGGGPLMCLVKGNPDRMVEIGMVSAGFGCGNSVPAMYVNVTRMRTWIDNELDHLGFEIEYDY